VDGSWKDQSNDGFTPTDRPDDHPVTKVSWEDAQKFCAWLSKREGKKYRLPTDEEWSYAVGIGRDENRNKDTTVATVFKSQADFPWGTDWPPPKDSGNFSDLSRKEKLPNCGSRFIDGYNDGFPSTAPVMSFMPNKLGIYDLSGNVREWCEDAYDSTEKERVLRGGSWDYSIIGHLLSSSRGHTDPTGRFYHYGFRCVIVSSP
jgi:formylglycine-generating enzyme required for sulfatase activity